MSATTPDVHACAGGGGESITSTRDASFRHTLFRVRDSTFSVFKEYYSLTFTHLQSIFLFCLIVVGFDAHVTHSGSYHI